MAEVVSVHEEQLTYKLFFMDGDCRDDFPEKNIRKVPSREMKDPMIGKKFFDDGSTDDNSPRSSRLKPGEFRVLCSQGSGYWCERLNDLDGKRDIQSFQKKYVKRLISK